MKKVLLSLMLAVFFMFSNIMPAVSADENVSNVSNDSFNNKEELIKTVQDLEKINGRAIGDNVVAQGEGYIVTIDSKQNGKKKDNHSDSEVGLSSSTFYSIDQGESGYFGGTTYGTYASERLQEQTSIALGSQHNTWPQKDYLGANGNLWGYYEGTRNATTISMVPSQTATASEVVLSPGLPPSVSYSSNGTSTTTTWPQVNISNNTSGFYEWDTIIFQTDGHFTEFRTNDRITWLFGSSAIGQNNSVVVAIN